MKKHVFTNRLIHQKSPYLLQHAHNPVDWYPWGEEAFQTAREKDKPIFLSIGYATCHWCHTMEKESFEDPQIADMMNEAFINIKVDREEMPEVDAIYMDFAQSMMAGSAGWPLNLILTPSLEPFFAATYLPPYAQHGMIGLSDLIQRVSDVWQGNEREKVEYQATKIARAFSENTHIQGDELPTPEQIHDTAEILFKIADPVYGGIRGSPKFPVGYQYNFLLEYSHAKQDSRGLFVVERTLDMMHRGGIYDHIGGGFARYSVDERWMIPHFEKMLYDNALLADAYIDAWRFTKKDLYQQTACEILDYVLRTMTHPDGGFYSAEDADSEGHEGRFYTWDFDEIVSVLGKAKSKVFLEYYNVTHEGNFEGRNVLYTSLSIDEFIVKHKYDSMQVRNELEKARHKLFEVREERIHPLKDDKILTAWNGLMIHSMAEAGCAFQIPKYLNAAKGCVDFIRTYLWDKISLFRRWRDGEALRSASLDDYAFFIRALITLFEKGEGNDYLEWAIRLTSSVEELFKSANGAFFQSDGRDSAIILRKCQLLDGAEPSGNAVHTQNLLRLYQITRDTKYLIQAEDVMKAIKKYVDQHSLGYFYHMLNLNRYYDESAPTFIIHLNDAHEHKEFLMNAINAHYLPHASVTWVYSKNKQFQEIESIASEYPIIDSQTTFYICHKTHCLKPITDMHEMLGAIQKY